MTIDIRDADLDDPDHAVLEDNRRARALYASFGFADVAVGSSTSTRFLTKSLTVNEELAP
jgi:hypothetical protein